MPDRYVRPLFVIGDSHCAPLNGLLLRDATGEPLAFGEAWCVQGLSARTALDEAGNIHPAVVAALAGFHLLTSLPHSHAGDVPFLRLGDRRFTASWIAATTPVLFTAGELDAREVIASIPTDAEPRLPFQADLSALPMSAMERVVPASLLEERIRTAFQPLFQMLIRLKALGVRRLALASLPPPNPDDDEYLRITGIRCRSRARSVVHMLSNSVLQAFCDQADLDFLDIWDHVTERNVAKPGTFADGLHLGSAASSTLLRQFFELALEARAS